ncbi:2OG-Fe(II) oxygenase family protein [Montanilutibacter psychrotolerans]|uniref:2OG-Fe(II) oxygenase n=1 Tax=Montanilutibacter psychrotolerans TaxID=1327343 RepID=A0A3M8SUI8_9GAMM|nr:2OG-Fe(II) oxygenase [Lysobacter psychrotolerans]RNF84365.1 2OG-Fe(II) oxygenase [Lysobacter psychrotolerans]
MNPPLPAHWLPGDRLPDVRLRAADGNAVTLHGEFAGAPVWLATPADATAASRLPAPSDGVVALCVGPAALDVPAPWRAFAADPAWCQGLGHALLWQADENLRLMACHALPLALPPAPFPTEQPLLPEQTVRIAPVLQIPGVFERELCEALIRHLDIDCGGGEASAVLVLENGRQTLQIDPSVKRRRESFPRDAALEARMHERVLRRALPEIARVFQFGVQRRDPFKLLAYPEGAGYFRAHRDNDTPDVAHRRFALSVNLNAGDYEGGEFRYPEFGPHRFSPATGTALVFSCSLLHEVLPVHRGTRYAMTTFLG